MLNMCIARRVVAASFVCAITLSSVFAQGVKKKVRFARGASSTTIKGGVIRGERDRYYVGAKKGQTMTVKITSEEDNAVFQIYLEGEQETLPGAGAVVACPADAVRRSKSGGCSS